MQTSILNSGTEAGVPTDERPAQSSLPRVWIGFIAIALIFVVAVTLGIVAFAVEVGVEAFNLVLIAMLIACGIYWLFCVHRFHKVMEEISDRRYPITPAEAVGKHFIPFYNFYWVFRWPMEMSDYVNSRGRVKMVSGAVLGLLMFLSMILRFFDGAIALAGLFGVGMYVKVKLKQHLISLNPPAELLPPPPDKDLFGYVPPAPRQNSPPSHPQSDTI